MRNYHDLCNDGRAELPNTGNNYSNYKLDGWMVSWLAGNDGGFLKTKLVALQSISSDFSFISTIRKSTFCPIIVLIGFHLSWS